jgi:ribonucleoside-triphosphate reductase
VRITYTWSYLLLSNMVFNNEDDSANTSVKDSVIGPVERTSSDELSDDFSNTYVPSPTDKPTPSRHKRARESANMEEDSPFPGHSTVFADANADMPKLVSSDEPPKRQKSEDEKARNDELPTPYQTIIHQTKYARYVDELERREIWGETVDRYLDFFDGHLLKKCSYKMTSELRQELRAAIINLEVMPSMRALMTAGPALERDNMAGYNCSYAAIDNVRVFDEILYILMCGTGVGFSAERQYITFLPRIPEFKKTAEKHVITVGDSKEGWAFALQQLIAFLYQGIVPTWDLSYVRPAGARLVTFGGRSSGPRPLDDLFTFTVSTFRGAQGRKLNSLEVHDLVCKIAEIVVVGGVRRSALLSLSNLSDDRMRTAKSGEWWKENPQRALANNSVSYTEKPEIGRFMKEWLSLYESKSGERGIFNREACQEHVRKNCPNRNPNQDFGCNPCSEIILPNKGLCNLTEVIIRADDTPDSLRRKVRLATILGTMQSTLTDFRYVSDRWRENCEKEYLLGVSLTGIMDNAFMSGKMKGDDIPPQRKKFKACGIETTSPFDPEVNPWEGRTLPKFLEELKSHAIETNAIWAHDFGINPSAAITTVKPSGTVSQLVDSASGIHTRHAKYYIRTIRGDVKDPITKFMQDEGIPWEPCVMKPNDTVVFSFPIKAPDVCVTRDDQDVLAQLEICKLYNQHWTQHKVSVTINVREHEWMRTGAWIWDNFDIVSGISFLPHSEHVYKQAPYQECTEAEYLAALSKMPKINWRKLRRYEKTDMTSSAKELACSAGGCEL